MSRSAQTFRQVDVSRALKGAAAAGIDVARVEIDRNGNIVLVAGKKAEFVLDPGEEDLDRELAELEARNGQG